jgi:hypothetical protein
MDGVSSTSPSAFNPTLTHCSDSPRALLQSIYFHDMDGVAACLRAVGSDRCVRVVRVSHKLADGYDSEETAGYRDVSLGLRLQTEAARRLGLHGFVFELQLILVDFARIKVLRFRKHIVPYRDLLYIYLLRHQYVFIHQLQLFHISFSRVVARVWLGEGISRQGARGFPETCWA